MNKWYVGIDETGDFSTIGSKKSYNNSFVAAVVTRCDHKKLSDLYRQAYKDLKFRKLENNFNMSQVLEHFHYYPKPHRPDIPGYTDEQKQYLFELFSPHMHAVIRSIGRPVLLANQQDWWLRAVCAVIRRFFRLEMVQNGDEVRFAIDHRAQKVLGLQEHWDEEDSCEEEPRKKPGKERHEIAERYHQLLREQIERQFQERTKRMVIHFTLEFRSDDQSPLVNLADLACGFVKDKMLEEKHIHSVPCSSLVEAGDVADLLKINANAAMKAVLSKVAEGDFSQAAHVPAIFNELYKDKLAYSNVWSEIHYLYSEYLETRGQIPDILAHLDRLRDELEKELEQPRYKEIVSEKQQIDFLLDCLIGLDTHLGATKDRYGDRCLNLLQKQNTERLSDHWESWLRLFIRRAQFDFNAYRFEKVLQDLKPLWKTQDELYKLLTEALPAPDGGSKPPDRSLAQILGTLGQAGMFLGRWDEAIQYLEEDFTLADEGSRSMPAGYLLCVYLHQKNQEECRSWFEKQVDAKPSEFLDGWLSTKRGSSWALLSYLRLRGLELELGGTDLPALDSATLQDYEKADYPYPWPLILKWAAFGLFSEGKKDEAKALLQQALKRLEGSSEFTLRTLALSHYQMLGLLRTDSKLRSDYKALLEKLMEAEPEFAKYVESHDLGKIWDDGRTLWERTMCLPGYYA